MVLLLCIAHSVGELVQVFVIDLGVLCRPYFVLSIYLVFFGFGVLLVRCPFCGLKTVAVCKVNSLLLYTLKKV